MYKIGNVGHQQRELRFPLGILHCHSLPPACWKRGAKALIPIGSVLQMAKRSWRLYLVFALLTCRSFLTVRLCTIPAAKALLVFGAGSRNSSLHRSLASAGKTRCHSDWSIYPHLSKALDRAYVPRYVLLFLCLHIARNCVLPAKAHRAMEGRSGNLL